MKVTTPVFFGTLLILAVQPNAKAAEGCTAFQKYLEKTFALKEEDSKTIRGQGCTVTISNYGRAENMRPEEQFASIVVTNTQTQESVEIDRNDCMDAANPDGVFSSVGRAETTAGNTMTYHSELKLIDSKARGFVEKSWDLEINNAFGRLDVKASKLFNYRGVKGAEHPFPTENPEINCTISVK